MLPLRIKGGLANTFRYAKKNPSGADLEKRGFFVDGQKKQFVPLSADEKAEIATLLLRFPE